VTGREPVFSSDQEHMKAVMINATHAPQMHPFVMTPHTVNKDIKHIRGNMKHVK
jgi:hypothetical protein